MKTTTRTNLPVQNARPSRFIQNPVLNNNLRVQGYSIACEKQCCYKETRVSSLGYAKY